MTTQANAVPAPLLHARSGAAAQLLEQLANMSWPAVRHGWAALALDAQKWGGWVGTADED